MIRVVLDTNILISALLTPAGLPAQVFLRSLVHGDIQVCVSGEVYAEYDEVLRRPRLRRSGREIEESLFAIRSQGFWVRPEIRVRGCSDKDDDIFLECAVAAGARYLVTGNLRHFPAKWAGVETVTARQFLDFVG